MVYCKRAKNPVQGSRLIRKMRKAARGIIRPDSKLAGANWAAPAPTRAQEQRQSRESDGTGGEKPEDRRGADDKMLCLFSVEPAGAARKGHLAAADHPPSEDQ